VRPFAREISSTGGGAFISNGEESGLRMWKVATRITSVLVVHTLNPIASVTQLGQRVYAY
jgi:hypothetical protein